MDVPRNLSLSETELQHRSGQSANEIAAENRAAAIAPEDFCSSLHQDKASLRTHNSAISSRADSELDVVEIHDQLLHR